MRPMVQLPQTGRNKRITRSRFKKHVSQPPRDSAGRPAIKQVFILHLLTRAAQIHPKLHLLKIFDVFFTRIRRKSNKALSEENPCACSLPPLPLSASWLPHLPLPSR